MRDSKATWRLDSR